ncbi:hypothetical protein, partial [Streptomyces sp. NPDC002172]
TMHYAKTLAVTAEREFLRYKKVTADGRTATHRPAVKEPAATSGAFSCAWPVGARLPGAGRGRTSA